MDRVTHRNNLSAIERSEYIKTSQDFFTKRNNINMLRGNNLSPIKKTEYSNIVNILKTDIIQLDNQLKKFSDILIYHRIDLKDPGSLSNLNIAFQKKCKELQFQCQGNNNTNFSNISENAKSLDFLFKHFKCINKDELIYKIAYEYLLDETILERINSFAFLINLRHFNEGNYYTTSYKESLSKMDCVRSLFDMISKGANMTQSIDSLSLLNESHEMSIKMESEVSKIMEMKNLSELFEYKTDESLILHIKDLITKLYEKIFFIFDDLNRQIYSNTNNSYRSFKSDDLLGSLFCIRESIEKEVRDKDSFISKLLTENQELKTNLIQANQQNSHIVNDIISKLEHQNNIITDYLSRSDSEEITRLNNEVCNLNIQLSRAKDNIYIQSEEIKYLNTKLSSLGKRSNLNESYDQLVLEQFDSMKNSFVNKIGGLSDELVKFKNESRFKITKVENELAVMKQMKDLFMSQIVNLKRII
jgi:hypothetical protein